jgi:hypothetical protein
MATAATSSRRRRCDLFLFLIASCHLESACQNQSSTDIRWALKVLVRKEQHARVASDTMLLQ